ncbi:hypothetical protein F4808DRAFT_464518 [Astrocystis sublimbata]|nr:hypothetical protein F4808DRAFT_464518 [Astrocystis sublimbata]
MLVGQQPTILSLGIAFPILSITAVILRFKARQLNKQKPGADDWAALVALVLALGVTADLLVMTISGGLGAHEKVDEKGRPVDIEASIAFGKTVFVLELLTWPAVGAAKIAVLLLYKRIFVTPRFVTTVWVLIGVVIAWTITFTFSVGFSRIPVQAHWDSSVPYHSVDLVKLFTTGLATDFITDFLILLLPVYKVWQLQMSLSRKLTLIGIFLLGILVSIVGLIRIGFLTQIYRVLANTAIPDLTWYYSPVYYWTIVESNVGVVSACLPTLYPVQQRVTSSRFFSSLGTVFHKRQKPDTFELGSLEGGLYPPKHEDSSTTKPSVDTGFESSTSFQAQPTGRQYL